MSVAQTIAIYILLVVEIVLTITIYKLYKTSADLNRSFLNVGNQITKSMNEVTTDITKKIKGLVQLFLDSKSKELGLNEGSVNLQTNKYKANLSLQKKKDET